MIKVLADKVLAFDRGERNGDGVLVVAKTKVGFCELPDWAAKTDYFKAAVADGSIKAFQEASESENVLKEQEKLAALKAEIAALEEKRDMLEQVNDVTLDANTSNNVDTGMDVDTAGTDESKVSTKSSTKTAKNIK